MFWKKKKKVEEIKMESIQDYSVADIERMTEKAIAENEARIKREQMEYMRQLERDVVKAARKGEKRVLTHSCDNFFDDYMTPSFIQEIADHFHKKGYLTTIVQPLPETDPFHMWVRIEWGPRD